MGDHSLGEEAAWRRFTPDEVNGGLCMARTWAGGCGGQCQSRPVSGRALCRSHMQEGGLAHGRVDGPIPEAKLRAFLRESRRAARPDGGRLAARPPPRSPAEGRRPAPRQRAPLAARARSLLGRAPLLLGGRVQDAALQWRPPPNRGPEWLAADGSVLTAPPAPGCEDRTWSRQALWDATLPTGPAGPSLKRARGAARAPPLELPGAHRREPQVDISGEAAGVLRQLTATLLGSVFAEAGALAPRPGQPAEASEPPAGLGLGDLQRLSRGGGALLPARVRRDLEALLAEARAAA